MDRILLLVEHQNNRRFLGEWLAQSYECILPESEHVLHEPFDLAILDSSAVELCWRDVRARKRATQPVFLPVLLLLTSRQHPHLAGRHLGYTVDALLQTPTDKADLQARVDGLLRRRKQSLALKPPHDDREALTASGDRH